MAASTQDHLPIQDIKDDVVILKDGSIAVIIQTSAVNFGLLSEQEQLAIISAFAGMLNSLSFMIQIIVRSKRLDISSYLKQLDAAQTKQTNPLLSAMIGRYRSFIKSTIQENEVLDKRFYIVIPVSYLETGAITKSSNDLKKDMAILGPRRDQLIRQLARIGLKSNQLTNDELIRLFYDIYNEAPPEATSQAAAQNTAAEQTQTVSSVMAVNPALQSSSSTPDAEIIKTEDTATRQYPTKTAPQASAQSQAVKAPQAPTQPVVSAPQPQIVRPATQPSPAPAVRRKPYIVEELPEDYGAA